jgi:hypothetical protein
MSPEREWLILRPIPTEALRIYGAVLVEGITHPRR